MIVVRHQLRDATAHHPGAQNADTVELLHLAAEALDAQVFLQFLGHPKNVDQILAHSSDDAFAEQFRFDGQALGQRFVIALFHRFQCLQWRRVIPVRRFRGFLACLVEKHLAAQRVFLKQRRLQVAFLAAFFDALPGCRRLDFIHKSDGRLAHILRREFRRNEAIHQAVAVGAFGIHQLAGKNVIQRFLQADQPWQSLAAAPPGKNPQLDFR